MPVAPTYPGVYIEEVPSGVRTITGVSTSVTAFIGFTTRGPVNRGERVLSYGDFERKFGGLDASSPVSYAVKQFFQNGGSEPVVVRVAQGAAAAAVDLRAADGTTEVLTVTAASEGAWGNMLRVDVDYATSNPADLFNLSVVELVDNAGTLAVGRSESFLNVSMNSFDPAYVVSKVNGTSELIRLTRPAVLAWGTGTSRSGTLTLADFNALDMTHRSLAVSVGGGAPVDFSLFDLVRTELFFDEDDLDARLTNLAAAIQQRINAKVGGAVVTAAADLPNDQVVVTAAGGAAERSSVRFLPASVNDASRILRLGVAGGGTESGGTAALRPMQTGTVAGSALPPSLPITNANITVEILLDNTVTGTATLPVVASGSPASVLSALSSALLAVPKLAGASLSLVNGRLRLLPPPHTPNLSYRVVDGPVSQALGLDAPSAVENVARYAPGFTTLLLGSGGGISGSNGTAPTAGEFLGAESAKTGIYALENVDLFNILCLPGQEDPGVLAAALAYAERRRAFLIVDLPGTTDSLAEAEAWLAGTGQSLRSRNAAAYFPWYREPDPLMGNVVRAFPPSGAIAGLYARTDSDRGVWKAPAGTEANIRGAVGLTATLTDRENGVLNPQGLNVIRTFPTIGTVVWGARTLRGADLFADEYKYVPIRRLALYLEESLYRGTQWVVFEPNDEPLWAQIRLNVGSFMQTLFRQGAFQGRSPREAYFVKCDRETNPQADIDRGIVNVAVGFAPLKPAEFVILRIQQIAPTP
jgi:phage tail sheath protein FI